MPATIPNILHIGLENPAELLNSGAYGAGAVIRVQSSATSGGTYANLTGTGSTPTIAIVSGTTAYTAYDPSGAAVTWYRWRLEDSTGAARVGPWTDPFQATPEGAGLLCQLPDVKGRLGIAVTDVSEDENLLEFIRQVSTEIMSYTGRRFARDPVSGTTTYTFDVPRWTKTVFVPQGIAEITQVEFATVTNGAYAVIPTADWFADPPIQERDTGWPATRITLSDLAGVRSFYPGKRVVRLTMALGFPAIPANISGLAARAVISNYLAKGTGGTGQTVVGPNNLVFLRDIGPADMAILTRYKEPLMGT